MTTSTTRNVEGLEATMAYIEAHPDEWDQDSWGNRRACGTSYCFAGTWALVSGAKLDWRVVADDYGIPDTGRATFLDSVNDGEEMIDDYAARTLGLNDDDVDRLFYTNPSVTEMRRLVEHLKAGKDANDFDFVDEVLDA